jgi:hypothetical protein
MMLRIIIPMALIYLFLSFNSDAQENSVQESSRIKRMTEFSRKADADLKKVNDVIKHLRTAQQDFIEIITLRQDYQSGKLAQENENWIKAEEKYRDELAKKLDTFSISLAKAMDKINDKMSGDQVALLYRYLRDELWYAGFINERSVLTGPVIDYNVEPTFDSTDEINNYTYEELEEMEKEEKKLEKQYIEIENKALISDSFVVMPADSIPESEQAVEIAAEVIESESGNTEIGLPPWADFPPSPATTESIRYLLEDQSLSVLKYYWLELYPIADSLLHKEVQKK